MAQSFGKGKRKIEKSEKREKKKEKEKEKERYRNTTCLIFCRKRKFDEKLVGGTYCANLVAHQ